MKDKLIAIGLIFGLLASCYGVFTFLERYALCEDLKKVDQKTDKIMQMMDYKFKAMELKTNEDRIYDMEKRYGSSPSDSTKKADLEKLKREREQILREMKEIKK
jgi:hypothetical protein